MLFAKDLLVVHAEDALPVRTVLTFYGQPVLRVWSDQKLDSIFTGTHFSPSPPLSFFSPLCWYFLMKII
jgi:hypothetical protein